MQQLDLCGLNCPLPVLKTKKFLADLPSYSQVKILTTDTASIEDLKIFCGKTGHKLISQHINENIIITIIERR